MTRRVVSGSDRSRDNPVQGHKHNMCTPDCYHGDTIRMMMLMMMNIVRRGRGCVMLFMKTITEMMIMMTKVVKMMMTKVMMINIVRRGRRSVMLFMEKMN